MDESKFQDGNRAGPPVMGIIFMIVMVVLFLGLDGSWIFGFGRGLANKKQNVPAIGCTEQDIEVRVEANLQAMIESMVRYRVLRLNNTKEGVSYTYQLVKMEDMKTGKEVK